MRKAIALAAAATLIALGMTPAGSAAVPPLRCGDTVTTDVVLTKDLTCSGDGLRVAADGITIDLNGHRLRGDGTGYGVGTTCLCDVTITDGRIEGFDIGIFLYGKNFGPELSRLHGVTVKANRYGVQGNSARMEITDSTFVRNDIGLALHDYSTVAGSSFRGNGQGITCAHANFEVVSSRFTFNQHGIDSEVCGATVKATSFTGGEVGLILVPVSFGMDISNNTFRYAGIGMSVSLAIGGRRVIDDNVFMGNGASGLVIDDRNTNWPGIEVSGNLFKLNGFFPGSHVDPSGNTLTSGVWANEGTFTGNRAVLNAGHGIEAYGATDGGGNTARHNGAEPQCVGVVCS